jgi:hypothetical protein
VAVSDCTATHTRCSPRFGRVVRRLAVTAAPTACLAASATPSAVASRIARCHAAAASRRAVRGEQ